jgi:D-alanyl-D-alanine carboxypeptidase/D-alanyl-D-alanine-endopeptidase (penicillin-binding protein 4)
VGVGAAVRSVTTTNNPGTATTPGPQSAPRALTALQRKLSGYLHRAGGVSGALVVDLSSGQTLFALSPDSPRLPASVQKLYTTTALLEEFGPTATLSTDVLGVGSLDARGTWHGTLYLKGGGDPTFGTAHFDRISYGPGVGATVQLLAQRLRRAGIRRVQGAIAGDESFLDAERGTPATRMAANFELEGELSGLAFDGGFVSPDGAALQRRPALSAANQFAAALSAAGVRVPAETKISSGVTPATAVPIVSVSSPPLSKLIHLTNAPSDNFFAEMLLKDLGAVYGSGGTTADGVAVVQGVIGQQFGIHARFNDGSGLSRYDRTTAAQVVSLLEQMNGDRSFVDSLAVAGVSGTMQHEMRGTRAAGNCRGKTGTLNDVANLAGYCTARNRDVLAFAFMLNSIASSDYGHLMEARMGAALANYDGPPAAPPSSSARRPASSSTETPSRSAAASLDPG